MQTPAVSIFNDVLGPIMTGPSSSHTAGPWRIGCFIHHLMPDFSAVRILFPQKGSYAGVYKGQKSDIALVAGLLGMEVTDPDFRHSLTRLQEKGIPLSIEIVDMPLDHPNLSVVELTDTATGRKLAVGSWSVGGGMFAIRSLNGHALDCVGDAHELLFLAPDGEAGRLDALAPLLADIDHILARSRSDELLHIGLTHSPSTELLQRLGTACREQGITFMYVPAILPVTAQPESKTPFSTAEGLLRFLETSPMPLWQAAVRYESARSGWTEEEVLAYAVRLVRIMRDSISAGLGEGLESAGFITPCAAKLHARAATMTDMGNIGRGIIYATAVMENNSAMGRVVAAPTAGSCGVIPGILFGLVGLGETDEQEAARALLCAGLIGVFIASQATFAAEVAACQAEIGAASCMGAAIVSHYLGSDHVTALQGASLALQNMLGLVCDPVAGCVDIPCINRNSTAVGNAFIAANMAHAGFDAVIPLDQTIQAMYSVGTMLPRELRCTGLGGLCLTAKAREIETCLQAKRQQTR